MEPIHAALEAICYMYRLYMYMYVCVHCLSHVVLYLCTVCHTMYISTCISQRGDSGIRLHEKDTYGQNMEVLWYDFRVKVQMSLHHLATSGIDPYLVSSTFYACYIPPLKKI